MLWFLENGGAKSSDQEIAEENWSGDNFLLQKYRKDMDIFLKIITHYYPMSEGNSNSYLSHINLADGTLILLYY